MSLTIKEAARLLGMSENRVRSHIASGKLAVERKGRQMLIPETELKALAETSASLESGGHATEPAARSLPAACPDEVLEDIRARLAALEHQLTEKWQVAAENQRLSQLLREQDRQLAEKGLELEKLHRDLLYQQRLAEKALEDQQVAFQERVTRMEQEANARTAQERERAEQALVSEQQRWADKLAQERERAEQLLARERQRCADKLAQEQERFARMLAAVRDQEGFWARLVRMITWS